MPDITNYYTHIFNTASIAGSIAFALSGFLIGARKQMDIMGIFILAFLTANGGGILRDVLVKDVPLVLHSDFYGSVALCIGVVIYLLHGLGALNPLALAVVFAAGLALRLIAQKRGWSLPKLR